MSKSSSGWFHDTIGEKKEPKQAEFNLETMQKNLEILSRTFPKTKHGYFGKKGNISKNRVIESKDQYKKAQIFWDMLSKGGIIKELPNKHGIRVDFDDKSYAIYRINTSTPGSPAIEITVLNSHNTKSQKIHFIGRK